MRCERMNCGEASSTKSDEVDYAITVTASCRSAFSATADQDIELDAQTDEKDETLFPQGTAALRA